MSQTVFLSKKTTKLLFFIYISRIFLQFSQICFINCGDVMDLTNINIFNNVLTFNHDRWRAGHAATNKNGDFIMEFSLNQCESQSRLFYGIKKDGRCFFENEPFFKEIASINCVDCTDNYKGRFDSINLFVTLRGDTSKEYLFSMSSQDSVVELIDIENDFTHFAWKTKNFFDLTNQIDSFQYALFEMGESEYLAVFIQNEDYVTLKKFSIGAFDSNNQKQIQTANISSNVYNGRVVTAFRVDSISVPEIVTMYNDVNSNATHPSTIHFNYFSDDLVDHGSKEFYGMNNLNSDYGCFFKMIHLKDIYFVIVWFEDRNNGKSLHLHLKKYIDINTPGEPIFYYDFVSFNSDSFDFRTDVQGSGLYKLTEDRCVLFTCSKSTDDNLFGTLHAFFIDFYDNYGGMKMREYRFTYSDKRFTKEMSAYNFNGFVVFTTTIDNIDNSGNNLFSLMMIFGYANGTDLLIDIYPYLMDTDVYNDTYNLYNFLMTYMKIDNNIFGYVRVDKIRLVSICDELLFYRGRSDTKENNTIELNGLFDAEYTLYQNKTAIKEEDRYYTLEYQFSVKEPDFSTFYSLAVQKLNPTNLPDYDGSVGISVFILKFLYKSSSLFC